MDQNDENLKSVLVIVCAWLLALALVYIVIQKLQILIH